MKEVGDNFNKELKQFHNLQFVVDEDCQWVALVPDVKNTKMTDNKKFEKFKRRNLNELMIQYDDTKFGSDKDFKGSKPTKGSKLVQVEPFSDLKTNGSRTRATRRHQSVIVVDQNKSHNIVLERANR